MTRQHEPDLPNEQAAEPTGGLHVDLVRELVEVNREETEARDDGDVENAEYWRGQRNGIEFAIMKLCDSGWKPVAADFYPDEEFVLSVEVSVSRKTGKVISRYGGRWDDNEELENAFDLIQEAAYEIVGLDPEEYVTDPAPRIVRLRQDSVPAVDTFAEPLMLSAAEVAASRFVYDDDHQFVFLMLPDGQTVRVEKVDVDFEDDEQ